MASTGSGEVIPIESMAMLQELSASHKYVIIDFWAEWCPPCKAIAPFYANLAKTHAVPDKLVFAKVDVDALPDVTQLYGITAMPSFLLLTDGEPMDMGALSPQLQGLTLIRGADPKRLQMLAAEVKKLAE